MGQVFGTRKRHREIEENMKYLSPFNTSIKQSFPYQTSSPQKLNALFSHGLSEAEVVNGTMPSFYGEDEISDSPGGTEQEIEDIFVRLTRMISDRADATTDLNSNDFTTMNALNELRKIQQERSLAIAGLSTQKDKQVTNEVMTDTVENDVTTIVQRDFLTNPSPQISSSGQRDKQQTVQTYVTLSPELTLNDERTPVYNYIKIDQNPPLVVETRYTGIVDQNPEYISNDEQPTNHTTLIDNDRMEKLHEEIIKDNDRNFEIITSNEEAKNSQDYTSRIDAKTLSIIRQELLSHLPDSIDTCSPIFSRHQHRGSSHNSPILVQNRNREIRNKENRKVSFSNTITEHTVNHNEGYKFTRYKPDIEMTQRDDRLVSRKRIEERKRDKLASITAELEDVFARKSLLKNNHELTQKKKNIIYSVNDDFPLRQSVRHQFGRIEEHTSSSYSSESQNERTTKTLLENISIKDRDDDVVEDDDDDVNVNFLPKVDESGSKANLLNKAHVIIEDFQNSEEIDEFNKESVEPNGNQTLDNEINPVPKLINSKNGDEEIIERSSFFFKLPRIVVEDFSFHTNQENLEEEKHKSTSFEKHENTAFDLNYKGTDTSCYDDGSTGQDNDKSTLVMNKIMMTRNETEIREDRINEDNDDDGTKDQNYDYNQESININNVQVNYRTARSFSRQSALSSCPEETVKGSGIDSNQRIQVSAVNQRSRLYSKSNYICEEIDNGEMTSGQDKNSLIEDEKYPREEAEIGERTVATTGDYTKGFSFCEEILKEEPELNKTSEENARERWNCNEELTLNCNSEVFWQDNGQSTDYYRGQVSYEKHGYESNLRKQGMNQEAEQGKDEESTGVKESHDYFGFLNQFENENEFEVDKDNQNETNIWEDNHNNNEDDSTNIGSESSIDYKCSKQTDTEETMTSQQDSNDQMFIYSEKTFADTTQERSQLSLLPTPDYNDHKEENVQVRKQFLPTSDDNDTEENIQARKPMLPRQDDNDHKEENTQGRKPSLPTLDDNDHKEESTQAYKPLPPTLDDNAHKEENKQARKPLFPRQYDNDHKEENTQAHKPMLPTQNDNDKEENTQIITAENNVHSEETADHDVLEQKHKKTQETSNSVKGEYSIARNRRRISLTSLPDEDSIEIPAFNTQHSKTKLYKALRAFHEKTVVKTRHNFQNIMYRLETIVNTLLNSLEQQNPVLKFHPMSTRSYYEVRSLHEVDIFLEMKGLEEIKFSLEGSMSSTELIRLKVLSPEDSKFYKGFLSQHPYPLTTGNTDALYLSPKKINKYLITSLTLLIRKGLTFASETGDDNLGNMEVCIYTSLGDTPCLVIHSDIDTFYVNLTASVRVKAWPKVAQWWKNYPGKWPCSTVREGIMTGGVHLLGIVKDNGADELWKIDFSAAKRKLIHQSTEGCKSSCLRIIKSLRDSDLARPRGLFPKHIENILLWAGKRFHSETDWDRDHLAQRFMDMLSALHICLVNNDCHHFFLPSVNMLANADPSALQVLKSKVRDIIINPYKYLDTDEIFQQVIGV